MQSVCKIKIKNNKKNYNCSESYFSSTKNTDILIFSKDSKVIAFLLPIGAFFTKINFAIYLNSFWK